MCSDRERSTKSISHLGEDELELTSSAVVAGAAYTCHQAFSLGPVLALASAHGLSALLEHLTARLLVSELIAAHKEVAEIPTGGELKDAMTGAF